MTQITSRRALRALAMSLAMLALTAAQVLAGGSNPPYPR